MIPERFEKIYAITGYILLINIICIMASAWFEKYLLMNSLIALEICLLIFIIRFNYNIANKYDLETGKKKLKNG